MSTDSKFQDKVAAALETLKNSPNHYLSLEIMDFYIDLLNLEDVFFVEACSEANQPKPVKGSNLKLEEMGFMVDPDDSGNYVKTTELDTIEGLEIMIEEIFSKVYDRDITSMDLTVEAGKLED